MIQLSTVNIVNKGKKFKFESKNLNFAISDTLSPYLTMYDKEQTVCLVQSDLHCRQKGLESS